MSAVFKCILGLFVVLCFVQFIEMARVPRDDAAVQDPGADLINNLQNLVGDVVNKLKTAVESEQVKVSKICGFLFFLLARNFLKVPNFISLFVKKVLVRSKK
ncbi:uncharacterized protein LOC120767736 [Bactrocera tryoni]|uniref:uncharacterized protein LOC120767736 n=1 Tax=Bactrocera tryoni TaxID=59916 RepID=UPI001A95E8E5|nr:uncharacterized protein LOC120767736 [Bactrocera tryoni]